MPIVTRLTERLQIRHPILSAPMGFSAGGRLAAAVTTAGGLGLIGGGYGDGEWLEREFQAAGNQRVGVGFITWSLAKQPHLLGSVLAHRPAVVMLSFGDPAPFAPAIKEAGSRLICQCQSIHHVEEAVGAGADVIVAQGAEAGGHGATRGTLGLVPEAADLLARRAPGVLLVAAGGIADGRGLAAALALGADGVLVGTRFWAASEAVVHPNFHAAIVAADGDATVRTTTVDIARGLDWPEGFTIRVRDNAFVRKWQGIEHALYDAADVERPKYRAAFEAGDADNAGVIFGEAAGLIGAIEPAATIVERMVAEAQDTLRRGAALVT